MIGIIWTLKKLRLTFISAYKLRVIISLMFSKKYLLLRRTVLLAISFLFTDITVE